MGSKAAWIIALLIGGLWAGYMTAHTHGPFGNMIARSKTADVLDDYQPNNDTLAARVSGHWAVLEGKVDSEEMKREIGDRVENIRGLHGVTNNLDVFNRAALERLQSMLVGRGLDIGVTPAPNGVVRLTGTVPDEAMRAHISDLVWAIGGVRDVEDDMQLYVAPPAPPQQHVIETRIADILRVHNIYFAFNKYTIREQSRYALDAITQVLREFPDAVVRIEGHTDHIGTDAYNMELSRKRAGAVRDALIQRGIASGRLIPEGYGEARPIAPNNTAEGRAENRRIEFRVAN